MSRSNPLALLAVLAAFVIAVAALTLTKGGLYVSRHEGDLLHLLDILFRMERGQMPHVDFMTPIGAFAFLPIDAALQQGVGVDRAFLLAQAGLAAGFLPLAWYAAWTRFPGILAYVFGLACLVLVLALVHGQAIETVSISMHYNRWAWALAFVAVALAVLQPLGRARPALDGLLIGLCVGLLVMVKITYAVALAPVLLVGLLLRPGSRALVAAVCGGLVVALAVTVWAGFGFWGAYLGDLRAVAASEVRAYPSLDFAGTLIGPAYIGATLSALGAIVLLRRGGADRGGLLALLLLPGAAYITFQNFGNDPLWLLLFGLVVLVLRDDVDEAQTSIHGWLTGLAVALLAFAAPSFLNLAMSPVRHAFADPARYASVLPGSERHAGLHTTASRANQVDARVPLGAPDSDLAALHERSEPTVFRGATLPDCEIALGLPGWIETIASDIDAAGYAEDAGFFVADVFSSHWMYNGADPLVGGAPWYYGGLPGWDEADYLLVPLCSALGSVRSSILEAVDAEGAALTEIRRTPLYILFSKD